MRSTSVLSWVQVVKTRVHDCLSKGKLATSNMHELWNSVGMYQLCLPSESITTCNSEIFGRSFVYHECAKFEECEENSQKF